MSPSSLPPPERVRRGGSPRSSARSAPLDLAGDLRDHERFGGPAFLVLVIVVVIVVDPDEDTMVLVCEFFFRVGEGGLPPGTSAASSSSSRGSSLTVWEGCEATASSEVPRRGVRGCQIELWVA